MAGIRIGQQAFPGDFVRKDSVDKRVLSQLSGVPFLPNYAIFEKNGTFVVPSGVERVLVLVIGGGGRGSHKTESSRGGCSGSLCSGVVNLGKVTDVTVISAGVGTELISNTSSFGNFITCSGLRPTLTVSNKVTTIVEMPASRSGPYVLKGGSGCGSRSVYVSSGQYRLQQTRFSPYGEDGMDRIDESWGSPDMVFQGTGDDPFKLYLLALGQLPGGTGSGGVGGGAGAPGYGGGGGAAQTNSQYGNNSGGSGGGQPSNGDRGGNGAPGVVCVFW